MDGLNTKTVDKMTVQLLGTGLQFVPFDVYSRFEADFIEFVVSEKECGGLF